MKKRVFRKKDVGVIQIQRCITFPTLDSVKQPQDERRPWTALYRKEGRMGVYACGVIFPEDPPSKAFAADSNVRLSDPEMLTFKDTV